MTRRYGRNQKRAHRERIAELEAQLEQRTLDVAVAVLSWRGAMERAAEAAQERDAAIRAAMLLDSRVLRKMPADALAAGELRLATHNRIEVAWDGHTVPFGMLEVKGSLRVLFATSEFRQLVWSDRPILTLYTACASLLVLCSVSDASSRRESGYGHGLILDVQAFRCDAQPDAWSAAGALQMSMAGGRPVWVKAADEAKGRRTA